ncbi:Ig-like domain-containing protein [Geodermatophilus nigrescens]|uniref:Ig-like domain-containing protein n=1 Tax=Geodermatophilus nigrescens TaxID=1070870 RepID=A0A1M5E4G4_9ACTN|nr:DUF4082 domain-containing protein [Geodermatophilus nigrescens]SHF73951.1 Ig-like domain-containing protein [Geodermatophilus nigrescens]
MDRSRARSVPSRLGLVLVALVLATVGLATVPTRALAADPCAPVVNPVVCENSKPGSGDWVVTPDSSIEGFTTDISADLGDRVEFKVRTDSSDYRIDVYRLGWYGGAGGRLVSSVRPSATLPQRQPDCLREAATGMVDCGNWAVSASWTVPTTAVSGVHVAVLHRNDTGAENQVTFVVRDDASRSDVVFQTSDTTWAAYNAWGGASTYYGDGPGGAGRAYAVSYNRPLTAGESAGQVAYAEYPMIRFLERNGYDVSYIAGVDTDRRGDLLTNHRLFLSVGHDEYWTGPQRAAVERAKAAGVHLAFFSGNEMWWRFRWGPSIDGSGTGHRSLIVYKSSLDGRQTDPSGDWTGTWRDPRFRQPGVTPENALIGQQFSVNGNGAGNRADSLAVPAEYGQARLWRNTAVAGQAAGSTHTFGPGTLGYEWDSDVDNGFRPAGIAHLSHTVVDIAEPDVLQDDFGVRYAPGRATHNLTLYRDQASGALVFGAGTVQWSWGLDDERAGGGPAVANTPMRQATVNLFADMGVQPATLQADLQAAAASTDTTPPQVEITAPAAGDTVSVGSPVTVRGTATDAGGVVSGVEVSVDGGATWHPAQGRGEWSYTYTPTVSGPLSVRARAVDDSARLSAPVALDSSVGQRTCPCSIWPDSAVPGTPDSGDATPIEVGVRWQSQVAGYVTGIRFYKGVGNTGTHTGTLWTDDGRPLASGTFAGETATGWQTLALKTPVAVTAGTTYVVSYFAPNGHYAADAGYFSAAPTTNEPLTALRDGAAGPNGVYRTDGPGFPERTFQGANYWVDVVFQATAPPDTTAPGVAPGSPIDGSSSVPQTSAVTAVFDEPVEATSIRMGVTGAAGSPVAGTTTYDPGTRTATFRPTEQLAAATRFTVTVSAATDPAGNPMAAPVSWSFTTARPPATPGVCPCSVWDDSAVPAVVSVADPAAVELGMRFRPDTDGTVTGVRFYKGPQNTGTHVGTLWSADGRELARATFGAESATGWQEVAFDRPVEVTAGTTYVVSYHTDAGYYSATAGGLSQAVVRSPLTALADGEDGPNGVYVYGARAFPTRPGSANYWVDVVFRPAPDTLPPTVTGTAPGAGSTSVPVDVVVSATFSEQVDPTSVTVAVSSGAGAAVPGTTAYDPETRTVRFSPSEPLTAATGYSATVSGVRDTSGNAMSAPRTWSFTTSGVGACPCTLFSDAVPGNPATDDGRSVELGTRLRFDVDGWVTGVRFYKGTGNTGTHTGTLWSADGQVLARGTFDAETASGWQQLRFANPVEVTAGTTYVVSYHAPSGHYAADVGAFTDRGRDNAPVHGLRDGVDGPNGVYAYGPVPAFPTSSHRGSNYWVDAVFETVAPADNTPPSVTATSPGDGWSSVPVTSPVQFTFDEAVQAGTATVRVSTAQGGPVTGTVSGFGSRTVVFTPDAPFPPGTAVTATVEGTRDLSGNAMAAPVTTSFTTAAGQTAGCPCTLFPDSAVPAVVADGDSEPIELGVRFSVDTPGSVTGVRFYKGPGNTGTHTGSLWGPDGGRLAQATFIGETSGGWQQVLFETPVEVSPGVTYTASYHTDTGHYSHTRGAFEFTGVDRGPLHAPRATATEPNGVYVYGASAWPTRGSNTDYGVDVVFVTDGAGTPSPPPGADTTPPQTVRTTPADGDQGVSRTAPVSAAFSEPLAASSVRFTLTGPAGAVPVIAGLDATGTTVTATPTAALEPGTTYTASLVVADTAGNAVPAPVTWRYTTGADGTPAVGECPCTLFADGSAPAAVADGDSAAVELGVRFSTDTGGVVTGVRFHKAAGNTGTHTGSLWAPDGRRLAQATFVDETASGWQTVLFDTPVEVSPGVTYTASYHTDTGHYGYTRGAFEFAGVDRGPLHAPQATATEPNGVYVYGASAWPTRGSNTDYGVDVVFVPQTAPVVTAAAAPTAEAVPVPTTEAAPPVAGPAPAESAPTTGEAPSSSAPSSSAPSSSAPSSSAPSSSAPSSSAPSSSAPETSAPSSSAPETSAPSNTAPETSAPETSAPSSTAPETSAPGTSAPSSTAPSSTAPSSTAPPTQTPSSTPPAGEAPAPAPVSLYTEADVPPERAVDDTAPAELGTRFTTAADVWVTALRVATGAGATGTPVGSLWTADGQRLASVRFADPTEPGWQTAVLGQPVALRAGEEYVVSHTAPEGRWTETAGGAATDRTSGPLTAPADRASAPNGVRGPAGAFPAEPADAAAFWVDVVVSTVEPPGAATDTARPAVTATGPQATALFSEPVEDVRMTLAGPDGTEVPAALGWDPRTLVARLEPAQALAPGTTWTVTVSAARDAAGNTLAGPVTWTFTT